MSYVVYLHDSVCTSSHTYRLSEIDETVQSGRPAKLLDQRLLNVVLVVFVVGVGVVAHFESPMYSTVFCLGCEKVNLYSKSGCEKGKLGSRWVCKRIFFLKKLVDCPLHTSFLYTYSTLLYIS